MKAVKIALVVLIVLVIIALAAGAYFYKTGRLQSLVPGTQSQSGVQIQDVVAGTVVSATDSSIVVQQSNGSKSTFKANSATRVQSVVGSGEVGKTLGQLAVGTAVAVIVDEKDSSLANTVSVAPPTPTMPAPNPEESPAQVVGVVTAVASDELTLTDTMGMSVTVLVPSRATILTRVNGGETGKTYADITSGTVVQVTGLTSTSGFSANIVGILAHN